jgi:hypothetical protein
VAIGLYYLGVGDYLQPVAQQIGGTWGTYVTGGHNSTFGVCWVSE